VLPDDLLGRSSFAQLPRHVREMNAASGDNAKAIDRPSDAWTQSECEEVVKDKKSVCLGRNACASRQAADDSEGSPLARPRPAAVISPSDVRDTRAVSACAHADSTLCKLVAPSGVIRALFPSGAAVAPFMHGGSGMFVLESPRLVACRLF